MVNPVSLRKRDVIPGKSVPVTLEGYDLVRFAVVPLPLACGGRRRLRTQPATAARAPLQEFSMNGMANISPQPGVVMHGVCHLVTPKVRRNSGRSSPFPRRVRRRDVPNRTHERSPCLGGAPQLALPLYGPVSLCQMFAALAKIESVYDHTLVPCRPYEPAAPIIEAHAFIVPPQQIVEHQSHLQDCGQPGLGLPSERRVMGVVTRGPLQPPVHIRFTCCSACAPAVTHACR